MKKIFSLLAFVIISMTATAQDDVTKFLGIPVDGSKTEMAKKIIEKGFKQHPLESNILQGEFNGINVDVHIHTTNNKVDRIMLCDQNTQSKGDIKIRFNRLCEQFKNNPKYTSAFENQTIPEDEDISYEMLVNEKRYEAIFYQHPKKIDTLAVQQKVMNELLTRYTQKQLEKPTDEIMEDSFKTTYSYLINILSKKSVWFMISSFQNKYYISMFYDNEYNRPNGQDL